MAGAGPAGARVGSAPYDPGRSVPPAATFIAANYTIPVRRRLPSTRAARHLLDDVAAEIGWMYDTLHVNRQDQGRINYTVWSEDVLLPGVCRRGCVPSRSARPGDHAHPRSVPLPTLRGTIVQGQSAAIISAPAPTRASGEPWQRIRLRPVLIDARAAETGRYRKPPDQSDLANLERIENLPLPPEVPANAFPIEAMYHGSRLAPKGFTHLHHLFLPRAAHALAALWRRRARDTTSPGCATCCCSSSSRRSGECLCSTGTNRSNTVGLEVHR